MSSRSSSSVTWRRLDVGDRQPGIALGRLDQHPGERHQPREPLRADRGLSASLTAPSAGRRHRSDDVGGLEVGGMALAEQLEPLGDLLGELGRVQHRRVPAPVQHPGDHLAAGGVVGLEDLGPCRASRRRGRGCGTRRTARSPARPARRSGHGRRSCPALGLAQLPLRSAGVVPPPRTPRAARSRAPPSMRRRPCRGSVRGGTRECRPARASGRSSRTDRPGRPGGRGPPCASPRSPAQSCSR